MNLNSVIVPPSSVTCDSSCQLSGEQNGPEKAGRFTNLLLMADVTFASKLRSVPGWETCHKNPSLRYSTQDQHPRGGLRL